MGILKDKVTKIFADYKETKDFNKFIKELVHVGDVRWQRHFDIVNDEVSNQLELMKKEKKVPAHLSIHRR
jgi:hypothetical protein